MAVARVRTPHRRMAVAAGLVALAAVCACTRTASSGATSPNRPARSVPVDKSSKPKQHTRTAPKPAHRAPARPIRRHHATKHLSPLVTGPSLSYGSTGAAVTAVQTRLNSLGYWVGSPSGYFGDTTLQAIYALQKASGIGRDGVLGPRTRRALVAGILPRPRPSKGHVVQVDLAKDLVMFTTNGHLNYVLNTSTGGGYTYSDQGGTFVAETPIGVFHIYSQINGLVTDSLGQLWMPKYFTGGFAIHGDGYVPPIPVSHGCVRVSNEAIQWIWSANLAPMGAEVWVYS